MCHHCFCLITDLVLLSTMWSWFQRGRKNLIGKQGTVTSVEPTTGTAAATAPSQKHQSPGRVQRAPSNRTVGVQSQFSAALLTQHLVLVSLALLMSSRCVSCAYSTEVHYRAARWCSVWVGLRLRQLVGQCEGQQRELGQLEQCQQHGGRQRPQCPNSRLHYLIEKK